MDFDRRQVVAALAAGSLLPLPACPAVADRTWARPGDPAWPDDAAWRGLSDQLECRLSPVTVPDLAEGAIRRMLANPYFIRDQPVLTQSSGRIDGWASRPSLY